MTESGFPVRVYASGKTSDLGGRSRRKNGPVFYVLQPTISDAVWVIGDQNAVVVAADAAECCGSASTVATAVSIVLQ